jgi:hypothetical protein
METTYWDIEYSVDGVSWWRLHSGLRSLDDARATVAVEKAANAPHYKFKILRVETIIEHIEEQLDK